MTVASIIPWLVMMCQAGAEFGQHAELDLERRLLHAARISVRVSSRKVSGIQPEAVTQAVR